MQQTLIRLAIDQHNPSMIQRLLARGAIPSAAESTLVERLMTPKESSSDSVTDADILIQALTRQRIERFNGRLGNALSDIEAALSELLVVEGSNKICDTIFTDATSVAQLLRVLKVQDWTAITQKDDALATMEGVEVSLIHYQSSVRALWEPDLPSKVPLVTRGPLEAGLHDRELREILDQIRRTRLAIDNAAEHLGILGKRKLSNDGLANPTEKKGQATSVVHQGVEGQGMSSSSGIKWHCG
jgi:hypothetical protein